MEEGATYGVYLSYHAQDSGYARRLRDELRSRLGGAHVYGTDDPDSAVLADTLGRCRFLVYVVGPEWLQVISGGEGGRQRAELQAALGIGVPMIAAQVGGGEIPGRGELPVSLQALHAWDGVRIADEGWEHGMTRLLGAIERTRETSPLRAGDVFAGHRIEAPLGRGGMAVVYRARHLSWDRADAIKVILPDLARRWESRERFIRESRMAASFQDENVVDIYDAGEESGLLYMTMRLVEGRDLATLIAQEGPASLEEAVDLLAPIAEALAHAHEHGLVHRDITPGNVLIEGKSRSRRVYLSDFGISHAVNDPAPQTGKTGAGGLLGTVDYMAPEQIRGEAVDGRADVYSLGCVLFELLSGSPPFGSRMGMAILYAHVQEPPPSLADLRPELPAAVDDLIGRAMAKGAADRPSAAEFRARLLELVRAAETEPASTPHDASASTEIAAPAQPARTV
jgi:hypothetical protein